MLACAYQLCRETNGVGVMGLIMLGAALFLPIILLQIAKLPVYMLALYVALVPFNDLLPNNGGTTITKLLAIIAGGLLILSMIRVNRVVKAPRSLFAALLFITYAGASIFWAIDQSTALQAYQMVLSLALLFAVISVYPATLSDFKIVLFASIVGALAVAVYGIYSYETMGGAQVFDTSRLVVGNSAGHVLDPNYYATALLVPIAVALVMFLRSNSVLIKGMWLAVGGTLFAGVVLSGSRGAVIAFAAMVIFLLWRLPYRKQLSAIVLAALSGVLASSAGSRFMNSDVANGDLRTDIWKIGLASLKQYWFAGAGIGNFNNAFVQYFLSVQHQPVQWDRAAHSTLVQSLVEYGVVGFVVVIALWYAVFSDLAYVRADRRVQDMCMALRAGIVGYFVAGISLDMMHLKFTWLAFELVILLRAALITAGVSVDPPPKKPRRKPPEPAESLRAAPVA